MTGEERPASQDERNAQLSARLSAWLDGELDNDGADEMRAQIGTDAALAGQAERLTRLDALVRAAVPEEAVPEALLQRLGLGAPALAEVVDLAAARRERAARAARAPSRWHGLALWRIAAQVLVVGGIGLGAALWLAPHDRATEPDAAYRTLSKATHASPGAASAVNAVVLFTPETDLASAHRIAGQAGAALVGQPNGSGAWKASIAPGRRDAVLAALRQDKRVTLAEPIDGAAP